MGWAGWLVVALAWLVCREPEGVVDQLAAWLGWAARPDTAWIFGLLAGCFASLVGLHGAKNSAAILAPAQIWKHVIQATSKQPNPNHLFHTCNNMMVTFEINM